jgi:hypothetical protein
VEKRSIQNAGEIVHGERQKRRARETEQEGSESQSQKKVIQSLVHDARHLSCVTGRKESEFGSGEMGAHDLTERQTLVSMKLKSGVEWSPHCPGCHDTRSGQIGGGGEHP